MRPGDVVRLRAYGDAVIERRLVEMRERVALVCTTEEWEAAQRENRAPTSIGFPREDVLAGVRDDG